MPRYRVPIRTATRFAIAHGLSHLNNTVIVNEWPKSGGTWISNLLSSALSLPFYDNVTPYPVSQVLKGHFIKPGLMPGGVLVWRDGRDVMISWYHHCFFKFQDMTINHARVDSMRQIYQFDDYNDVRANLPAFLEREFQRPSYPSISWPQFVEMWHENSQFTQVRYEDFKADTVAALTSTLTSIAHPNTVSEKQILNAVDTFDIEKIRSRRKPNADSKSFFVRQGKSGGWKDVYSDESAQIFDYYGGDALKVLGYS